MKDALPSFLGFISNVFDPYLSAFVNSEKQNFAKLLERAVKGDELVKGGELPGAAGRGEALPVPEGDVVALRDDEHGTDAGGDESVGEAGEREPAR